ncbi:CPBP family intramembrane glutamic endopeptidase [Compostibacter hankyongensis]|uniref:CAAX prenyl protease 2/Lysostaphin resistance protein A-like domain-containing protein n=1 Tax=Compostibacter hankyongensis TaxID=1007089 RepID=A0ABP8G4N8_9BACT
MAEILKRQTPFVRLLGFIVLFLGCMILYNGLLLGGALSGVFHVTPAVLAKGDFSDPQVLSGVKAVQLCYSLICFLLPALLFNLLFSRKPFADAGLAGPLLPSLLLLAVVILAASLPFAGVLADWNRQIHFPWGMDAPLRELERRAADMTRSLLVMPDVGVLLYNLLLIAIVPAIAEEWFFRGVLQRLLIRMSGRPWLGILIAAVIFSLLHGEMLGFFPRLALGIVLGCLFYFSGSLWTAITAHFLNNGLQIVLTYLHQHHHIAFDITQDTPTPLAAGAVSGVLTIALFLLFRKLSGDRAGLRGPEATEKAVSSPPAS